jgi:hypothetical protein
LKKIGRTMGDNDSCPMAAHALLAALLLATGLSADDGIWLFNQFPKARVRKAHGVDVSDSFLDRLRLASVRLEGGGSGSFVSPRGLVFTNHHVASDCIQRLSSAGHDYMANGFWAPTEAEEKPCPAESLNVLLEIRDVTARINAGITPVTAPVEASQKRKSARTAVEQECTKSTGNLCQIVTLYSGGLEHLYRYKKYTDVRLVFAPEDRIAAFGGDPDNFEFPRYCLDFAFLRAYENGKPAESPNYLSWSKSGAREGDLMFVSGHPATTGRLATLAELEFNRDYRYPLNVETLGAIIADLQRYSAGSAENKRVARDLLVSLQNSFKAFTGFLGGLRDPALMAVKRDEDSTLKSAAAKDPRQLRELNAVLEEVGSAYRSYRPFYKDYHYFEYRPVRGSDLFKIALNILRYGVEKAKPNHERLRDFVDSALPRVEQSMFAEIPIHDSLEIVVAAAWIRAIERDLGAGHPLVKEILAGRTPARAAEHYVRSSTLRNVAERKRLAAQPAEAASSSDGMIQLARVIDPYARRARKQFEDKVEAAVENAAGRIARVRFEAFGTDAYPDATFTLRLSFGPAIGYRNRAGEQVSWATDFQGLYRRATGVEPYALPERWKKVPPGFRLGTPFNFVTTADSHGGNSGSPTVNAKGEITGILFDGNIGSLPNRFVYRSNDERSVHVASQGTIEALRHIYGADRILAELGMTSK